MRNNDQPNSAELAQLNAMKAQRIAQTPSPLDLEQLRQMQANLPQNRGLWPTLKHGAEAAIAGPAMELQNIGKSFVRGHAVLPGLGIPIKDITPGAAKGFPEAQAEAAPVLNYNVPAHMGIPQTLPYRLIEGVTGAAPLMLMGAEGGIAPDIAQILGRTAGVAGYGAETDPRDPIGGGIESGLIQGIGDMAPILGKLSKGAFKARSLKALTNYGQGLEKSAGKSYDVLNRFGKNTELVNSSHNMMPFGSTTTIGEARGLHPGTMQQPNLDEIIQDAHTKTINNLFDPRTLNDFKNLKMGAKATSLSQNAFDDFAKEPTINKAINLKGKLSRDWALNDPSRNATLMDMKDQLRERVIYPFLKKNATREELDKYSMGDLYHHQLKNFTQSSPLFDAIAHGRVAPRDISGEGYLSALTAAKKTGAFDPPEAFPEQTIAPMKQYLKMHKVFGDEAGPLKYALLKAGAAGRGFSRVTPLLQAAAFTGQQMPS